ncbi:POC1 centriolar protein A [Phlyctochytrium bullatum]|nr:POC1 centriolar protein A [Phlyctochytrium bullatum]
MWLFDQLFDWVEDKAAGRALWLNGPSGHGKSVALFKWASKLPERIRVVWFQIRPDHTDRLLPSTIINTLAFRLATEIDSVKDGLLEVLRAGGDIAERDTSTPQRIRRLLVEPLRTAADFGTLTGKSIVIILDGLEALPQEPRKDLLDGLLGEWERLHPSVRIIFSSVKEDLLSKQLEPFKPKEIALVGVQQRKDLRAFAGALVKSVLPTISRDDEDEACSILITKSLGQFLWLNLAFQPLKRSNGAVFSGAQLLAELETFPSGVDQVYLGLLQSRFPEDVPPTDLETFRRVLGSLMSVKEPVSISTLANLIDLPLFDVKDAMLKVAEFLEFCDESINTLPHISNTLPTQMLRLNHTDFRDFLTTQRCSDVKFRISLPTYEAEVAIRCMTCILINSRPNPLDLEDPAAWFNNEIPDLENRINLKVSEELRYSIKYWCFHLLSCSTSFSEGTSDLIAAPTGIFPSFPGASGQAPGTPSVSVDIKLQKAVEGLACLVCSEKILEWLEHLSLMSAIESTAFASLRALFIYLESIKPISTLSSVVGFLQRNIASAAMVAAKSISTGTTGSNYTALSNVSNDSGTDTAQPAVSAASKLLGQTSSIDIAQAKALVRDAQRFLQDFKAPLVKAAYHIYISALPFSPNGSALYKIYSPRLHRAASSSPSFRRIPKVMRGIPEGWNPCLWTIRAHSRAVSTVSVSMDGRWIVSGGYDRVLRVFDAETGMLSRALEGHTDQIWNITCSPDGRWIVSGAADETVRTWDTATGRCVNVAKGKTWGVNSLVMSLDGSRIVSVDGPDKAVTVRDAKTGDAVFVLKGHQAPVCGVCISPDSRYIVSCAEDKTIRVWDGSSGRGIRTIEGHANVVNTVCISPDGRWIVSGSRDTTVRVWDIESGRCAEVLEGHTNSVTCVAVSPDGLRIVSGSDDKTVRVWDCDPSRNLPSNAPLLPQSLVSFAAAAASVTNASPSLTPSSASALLTSQHSLRLNEEGHGATVRALSVSDDGRFITSAGADSTVRVWNAETGKLIRVIETRTLNVASWEDAARRVAKAEMLGLTDGGASGLPADDEDELHGLKVKGSPDVTHGLLKRSAPTVLSINGVAFAQPPKDGIESDTVTTWNGAKRTKVLGIGG